MQDIKKLELSEVDKIIIGSAKNDDWMFATSWIKVPIKINSSHRPVFGKEGAKPVAGYKSFKSLLTKVFKGTKIKTRTLDIHLNIPSGDYFGLELVAFFPPHKTEQIPLVRKEYGERMRRDPDCDNIIKGIQDALQKAKVLEDDNIISDLIVRERFVDPKDSHWFEFRLFGYEKREVVRGVTINPSFKW
jgi:hypothetical protein